MLDSHAISARGSKWHFVLLRLLLGQQQLLMLLEYPLLLVSTTLHFVVFILVTQRDVSIHNI